MSVAQLPVDLDEATKIAEDLDIRYDRLKMWWTRRLVRPYKRGDGRILLSRAEVARVKEEQERITPLDGE